MTSLTWTSGLRFLGCMKPGHSRREMAWMMRRSASTIGRELRRIVTLSVRSLYFYQSHQLAPLLSHCNRLSDRFADCTISETRPAAFGVVLISPVI